MTREDLDFIGSMNMCDEISDEAYKKIVCHFEGQEPCGDCISRQAVLDLLEDTNNGWIINEVSQLPSVNPQEKTDILDRIKIDIINSTLDYPEIDLVFQIIDKYRSEL